MKKLRVITGVIIALHGLLRIVFMKRYINFVHENFHNLFLSNTYLDIGTAILPFIEFFIGLLILSKVGNSKSLIAAFVVSLVMSIFIIAGNLYPRLIYHAVICVLLLTLFVMQKDSSNHNVTL